MDSLSQEITIIVIASAFFLMVAIGIIIIILIHQKKQLRYIYEKQELQNQFQKELLKTRLEVHDETLDKLSKELHDNIGQLMSTAKVLIGTARRTLPDSLETLQLAGDTVSTAIGEIRALSKSLNTDWLEKFDFFENLRTEAARINASKEYTMSIFHPERIDMVIDQQLMLFRIVQEAFQNSLKHGKADHINIKVEQNERDHLSVIIEDDGNGFDVHDITRHGLGMTNIKNRAAIMGGTAVWKSGEKGTSVLIKLPLKNI
jgi:signal transduction histidine kinase